MPVAFAVVAPQEVHFSFVRYELPSPQLIVNVVGRTWGLPAQGWTTTAEEVEAGAVALAGTVDAPTAIELASVARIATRRIK